MIKIIKRVSMFLTFGFLLTLTSSCEDLELNPITPTIAQKVNGLSVDLNGDDAVLTWTNPPNASSIVVVHTDGVANIQSAATTFSYGIIDVNKDYTFTVKTKDAEGNLSLGETVSLPDCGVTQAMVGQNLLSLTPHNSKSAGLQSKGRNSFRTR